MVNENQFTAKLDLTDKQFEALKNVLKKTKHTGQYGAEVRHWSEADKQYLLDVSKKQVDAFLDSFYTYIEENKKEEALTEAEHELLSKLTSLSVFERKNEEEVMFDIIERQVVSSVKLLQDTVQNETENIDISLNGENWQLAQTSKRSQQVQLDKYAKDQLKKLAKLLTEAAESL